MRLAAAPVETPAAATADPDDRATPFRLPCNLADDGYGRPRARCSLQ